MNMTTVRVIESHGGLVRSFRINSKQFFFDRVAYLKQQSPSRWFGRLTSGLEFTIEGGKACGGSARDWFLDIKGTDGSINCTSMVDALRTINAA